MKHLYHYCRNEDCPICNGNLKSCVICHQGEGTLEPTCPGGIHKGIPCELCGKSEGQCYAHKCNFYNGQCLLCKKKKVAYQQYAKAIAYCNGVDFNTAMQQVKIIENKDELLEIYNQEMNRPCPVCNGTMTKRTGKYGDFLGCNRYPDCRGTITIGNNMTPTEQHMINIPERTKQAMDFIHQMGGVDSAHRWIDVAAKAMEIE